MKIAIFSHSFPVLSETFVINQIVGLIENGVEVEIVTNDIQSAGIMHSTVNDYDLIGRVKQIGKSYSMGFLTKKLSLIKAAFMLLMKFKISQVKDVLSDPLLERWQKVRLLRQLSQNVPLGTYNAIVCHFGSNGYYVSKMKELGIIQGKLAIVFHAFELSKYDYIKKYTPHYKKLFEKDELLLPISEKWKNLLLDMGASPSQVKVHRMGIEPRNFEFEEKIESFTHKKLKVIQVGRLTEKKAILDSIQSVVLASKKVNIQFDIIGDGELLDEARTLIKSSRAESFITLHGPQSHGKVKEFLQYADVFILPSVRASDGDMEGIPVALMEAMASGILTLSTFHSGIPELIENTVSGFLVEENSPQELCDALVEISNLPPDRLNKIRKLARQKCEVDFNNEILNKSLIKLLSETREQLPQLCGGIT